jgi:predicted DNA-binding transcriptional regulator AlpA
MIYQIEEMPQALNELQNQVARLEKALAEHEREPPDEVLDVRDAGRVLGLSPKTIYNKVDRNQIPHSRNAGHLRFSRNELIRWATGKKD